MRDVVAIRQGRRDQDVFLALLWQSDKSKTSGHVRKQIKNIEQTYATAWPGSGTCLSKPSAERMFCCAIVAKGLLAERKDLKRVL